MKIHIKLIENLFLEVDSLGDNYGKYINILLIIIIGLFLGFGLNLELGKLIIFGAISLLVLMFFYEYISINRLLFFFIIMLPFATVSYSLNGVQIKIYELLGLLLIVKTLLHIRVLQLKIPSFFYFWFIYLIILSLSFIYNLESLESYSMESFWAVGQETPKIRGLLEIFYLIFNILIALSVYSFFISREKNKNLSQVEWFLKVVVISGVLSSIFGIIKIIFYYGSFNHLFHYQIITLNQYTFPRLNAAMLEGNFFGLYLLLCIASLMILGLLNSKNKFYKKFNIYIHVFLVFSLLMTVSTINILSYFLMFLIYSFIMKKSMKQIVVLVVIITIFLSSSIATEFIYGKIFSAELNAYSFSKFDRLNSIVSGIEMFKDSPVIGMGPSGYSYMFPYYDDFFKNPFLIGKRIPNNIYVHWLVETGLFGFIMSIMSFAILLIALARNVDKRARYFLLYLIPLLVVFNAYPTYTLTIIWLIIGICLIGVKIRLFK
jgi:O-antigen ligase